MASIKSFDRYPLEYTALFLKALTEEVVIVLDDYLDAAAGCVALLDPFAAQAAGDKDLSEDEYPPLEEVLGANYGEWAS